MNTATALINPMWDELSPLVGPPRFGYGAARQIDHLVGYGQGKTRFDYASKYSWTITAPDTVSFVAEHLNGIAVDPLAGSGYWAFQLAQLGVDVIAHDINPPTFDKDVNRYHHAGQHVTVHQVDAVETITYTSKHRALLLSWPPYEERIGADLVDLYAGDRIVYIGEGEGGCCGDDRMFRLLDRGWTQVAEHEPVQWAGMHDFVQVFDRKSAALPEAVLEGEIVEPFLALPAGAR